MNNTFHNQNAPLDIFFYPYLDLTDEELLYVNKDDLTEYDKDRRNKFLSSKDEMINLIMK